MAAILDRLDAATLFSVRGKNVLVTGGGRGIGKMIAQGLAINGAFVLIASRNGDACVAAAQEISNAAEAAGHGGACEAVPGRFDLGTAAGATMLAERVAQRLQQPDRSADGRAHLHVLVNNSGTSWGVPLEKYPESGWDKVMSLNLKGVFFLTKECVPMLGRSARQGDPARVINIGSIAGIKPQTAPTYAYDASKAGLHHMTRNLAAHLAERQITVNAIAPGWVPTAMGTQLTTYRAKEEIVDAIPLKRPGGSSDMAGVALLLSSAAGSWITGTVIPVDGGALSRL
eukprot:NODE_3452_length_973_cov_34.790043_g3170_i0.p1 GENE.NODE_3452_length_973_cov_34.790043_g3170_i0~~NODE_3452_length_973_cov_34.790043_g3170_i0.p1  ORF type:complete len:286 (-),score=52.74 NODE_3452_length_973_cov_34.790043_g3170_i0:62-919(-)